MSTIQRHAATTSPARTRPPALVLAVVCLSVLAVNIDTTIVNVTLPTLVTSLGASTRELQWVVDAYLLAFAGLVLAGGNLSDRWGRRAVLVAGLAVFGVSNLLAAWCTTPEQLIAARALGGVGAAAVFPTTLSIIVQVYRERDARARAIGIWGAVTGLAVALGPIAGGALLERWSWTSTFLVKVPVAVLALVLVLRWVPESRSGATGRLDVPGLLLSALGLGALVFSLIEAPEQGWLSTRTLAGGAVAAALLLGFVLRERRAAAPVLDVRLFADRRFSAASGAITIAFFALFGFIFLITQYLQLVRGYSPLEAGVRTLPVAVSIAIGSVAGTALAVRYGSKLVVTTGLVTLGAAYAWISTVTAGTGYGTIALQMVALGLGMGLTTAPATESLMGAVRLEQAGAGSAVNDATREVGGTLGVAVIGSVFASLYSASVDALRGLPPAAVEAASDSLGAALAVASRLPAPAGEALRAAAETGFLDGLRAGSWVAAGVALAGAVATAVALPSRPTARVGAADGAATEGEPSVRPVRTA